MTPRTRLILVVGDWFPEGEGRAPAPKGDDVWAALTGQQSVFTYGGSVAFGSRDGPVNLRLTGLRTSGSLVSTTEGMEPASGTVRDRMLALTGDVVVRPIPRFLIQPYAIGGGGRTSALGPAPRRT